MKKNLLILLTIVVLFAAAIFVIFRFNNYQTNEKNAQVALNLDAEKFLFKNTPTKTDLNNNWAVIMSHGLSASYYEWQELAEYLEKFKPNIFMSRIILGGHSTTVKDFYKSKWQDWQKPLLAEYQRVVDLGFKNIMVVVSSTSGPLLLEAMSRPDTPMSKVPPKEVVMIDPIYNFSQWYANVPYWLSVVNLEGAMDSIAGPHRTSGVRHKFDNRYWYASISHKSIASLGSLLNRVGTQLNSTNFTGHGTNFHIYSSQRDPTIDPKSGFLIAEQLKAVDKDLKVEFIPMDSGQHVFSHLRFKELPPKNKDLANQELLFEDIRALLNEKTANN